MRSIVFTAMACALVSACGVYRPTPAERVHIVSSPVDTYKCRHLGEVGGPSTTAPNFDAPLETMVERTAALGGNTLYLARRSRDWAYVKGSAHWCWYLGEPPFQAREASHSLSVSPGDEVKGTTVPGDRVVHPRLTNARSGATASKLTLRDEGNRAQEAPAAREAPHSLSVSPGDEVKGTTVPGNGNTDGRASVPAVSSSPRFKVADGTLIARDESRKVVRFHGNDLSDRDCHLLTSDLTLRSNGTAVFEKSILGMGRIFTYIFYFHYYDQQWRFLFKTPILSHRISEEHTIYKDSHEITSDMSDFGKIEHVKISFKCEKEGSDNPSANDRSELIAPKLTPKGEGNRTQDAYQRLPASLGTETRTRRARELTGSICREC